PNPKTPSHHALHPPPTILFIRTTGTSPTRPPLSPVRIIFRPSRSHHDGGPGNWQYLQWKPATLQRLQHPLHVQPSEHLRNSTTVHVPHQHQRTRLLRDPRSLTTS